MRYILPRTILGNRGDLASRWGVLAALKSLGADDVVAFQKIKDDTPDLGYTTLFYGKGRNLILPFKDWKYFKKPGTVLWSVGLDFQDDSSQLKLLYLWVAFSLYRFLGLKVCCLFQGAGPLRTDLGRWLAAKALKNVNLFIARDPGTYNLIGDVSPKTHRILAHDAIFLPGFEAEIENISKNEKAPVDHYTGENKGKLIIGINIRQWFHFTSSILPYQMNKSAYQRQSQAKMDQLISSTATMVKDIREELNARVLFISAYQPGVVPWEDDLQWLQILKSGFDNDPNVVLTDTPMSMRQYFYLMSKLNVMIGMRLHSSLIALRMGVPSINISYTLKGKDILEYMGLGNNVVDIKDYLENPRIVTKRLKDILSDIKNERELVEKRTQASIQENMELLSKLVQGNLIRE